MALDEYAFTTNENTEYTRRTQRNLKTYSSEGVENDVSAKPSHITSASCVLDMSFVTFDCPMNLNQSWQAYYSRSDLERSLLQARKSGTDLLTY